MSISGRFRSLPRTPFADTVRSVKEPSHYRAEFDVRLPTWRIVSLVSRPMGSTARAFGRRQGVETLRYSSLIASLRTSGLYLLTALLVAAFSLGSIERPLASAIAAERPASASAQALASGETASASSTSSTAMTLPQPDPATVKAVAAAENAETATSI